MTDSLIIGGRQVSLAALLDFTTSVDWLTAGATRRLGNGTLYSMERWRKIKVSISAKGWVPPAILSLDWSQPMVFELPIPWAQLAGDTLPEGVTLRSGDWAGHTVTDQSGFETHYAYIQFTGKSNGPAFSRTGGDFPWSMEIAQV